MIDTPKTSPWSSLF